MDSEFLDEIEIINNADKSFAARTLGCVPEEVILGWRCVSKFSTLISYPTIIYAFDTIPNVKLSENSVGMVVGYIEKDVISFESNQVAVSRIVVIDRFDVIKIISCGLARDLRGADLSDCSLEYANLEGVDFKGANLSRANLNFSHLIRANFKGANLEGATLVGVSAKKANFKGANLQYADLNAAFLNKANFKNANLQGVDFSDASLRGAFFSGADLRGANFAFADLSGAVFNWIDRSTTNFGNAIWGGTVPVESYIEWYQNLLNSLPKSELLMVRCPRGPIKFPNRNASLPKEIADFVITCSGFTSQSFANQNID